MKEPPRTTPSTNEIWKAYQWCSKNCQFITNIISSGLLESITRLLKKKETGKTKVGTY
jgi:hypothetical protein